MEKLPRKGRLILILAGILAVIGGGGWLCYRWVYPYGWSHSCDKVLMFALNDYAKDHRGDYPAGQTTPEACLSLLYPKYCQSAEVLRGKTVPRAEVQAILRAGKPLGPDTCGWHYVPGLRLNDDRHLALCWDKVGLGHNGERLFHGGHWVLFVNMGRRFVPGSKWDEFLRQQQSLLKEKNALEKSNGTR